MTDTLKARIEALPFFSVNAGTEKYYKASDIFALLDEWCKSPEVVEMVAKAICDDDVIALRTLHWGSRSSKERYMSNSQAALTTIMGEK